MKKAVIKNIEIYELQGKWRITGDVYGHPDFKDGTRVTTSSIQKVITRNSEYTFEVKEPVL